MTTTIAHQLHIPGRGWIECEPHAAEAERQRGGRVRRLVVEAEWQPIETASRSKNMLVVSERFPEVHEARLYDDGWFTWGPNGALRDNPTHWTLLPPPPALTQETPR